LCQVSTLDPSKGIDAGLFQRPLGQLTETMAQKIQREAPRILPAPEYVCVDMFVMLRQALCTYSLLFYLASDERRQSDPFMRNEYSIVASQTVRSMIDCLYNITFILENPSVHGEMFRKSGFKKVLKNLDEDTQRYGGQRDWDDYLLRARAMVDQGLNETKITKADLLTNSDFPTLGAYLGNKQKGGVLSPHQQFLKTFTYGPWREYSAVSHGGFEGLINIARFLVPDVAPHEVRHLIDDNFVMANSQHLFRASYIVLCTVTELQLYFHFRDANIDSRIHVVWDAIRKNFEAGELYDQRYAQLMRDKGINP